MAIQSINKYLYDMKNKYFNNYSNKINKVKNEINEISKMNFINNILFEYNDENIDFSKSDFLNSKLSFISQSIYNDIDSQSLIPNSFINLGHKPNKRYKNEWTKNNICHFIRNYNKESGKKIFEKFGRPNFDKNKILKDLMKQYGTENLEIIFEDYFGLQILNKDTNEDIQYYYPIPKILNTFISNRAFNMGSKMHDMMTIFYDETIINQPKINNFLLNEINTDSNTLEQLLRHRNNAIQKHQEGETGIIPGQMEYKEENDIKIFPDNRKGIYGYISEISLSFNADNLPNEFTKGLAENLLNQGYKEEKINQFLQQLEIPKKSNIPQINKVVGGFRFEVIDKLDPVGVVLGNITGCCQKLGGQAESCVIDGYNNPNSGFLVVYNEDNKIVAQSWLRLGVNNNEENKFGNLYLDNIETISSYSGNVKLQNAYEEFANKIKSEYGFSNVVVGTNYSEINFPNKNKFGIIPHTEFPDYSPGAYSDLKNNVLLAKNWYNIFK